MQRYFFDIRDDTFLADDTGTEFPSLPAARTAAVAMAGQMLSDRPDKLLQADNWQIEVRVGEGPVLFTFGFVATDGSAARAQLTPLAGETSVI